MIVAAAADSVIEAAGGIPGVELRALDEPLDDVEFLVPRWGEVPDLSAMPALRVVQLLSAGTDWIDEALPDGVTLCNARGARDIPVAEWIVGAILGTFTGLLWAASERCWEYRPPREVHGARVLIVGHGSIGRETATRLEALGAHVTGIGRAADPVALAADADVVVNLVPLTEESAGMFGRAFFDALRDGALFVNAGRGGTVDQAALVDALPRIDAVLDVASPEPLPADDPLWGRALAITGHQAGDSAAADGRCVVLAVEQLRRYAEGRPLRNVVPR